MIIIQYIPTAIFSLLIVVNFIYYLFQGYLIQIDIIKWIYLLSSLGLINQFILFWENWEKKLKWIRLLVDAIILSLILYLVPSGQQIAQFFILIYLLYAGLSYGTRSNYWLALYFYGFSSIILVVDSPSITIGVLLNLLTMGASYLIMVILSQFVYRFIEDTKVENTDLETLNAAIFEQTKFGLIITNLEGEIINANPTAKKIFSQYKLEFKSSNDSIYEIWPELRSLSLSEENTEDLDLIRRVDEDYFFYKVKFNRLPIHKQQGYLHFYTIEDRTILEKLEQAKRQSEKMAAVGTLAAGIAHEIRNPLTGISGALQLLEPNLQSEEEKKLYKIVFREIDRLNNLISEFLDYSRPELPLPSEPISVTQVLKDCLSIIKNDSRFKFLENMNWPDFPDFWMLGFADKLKQVFLNILVNSAQALEKSETKFIKVSMMEDDAHIIIKIIDSGIGMDKKTKEKIFEPFHTTKPKGTGLGMAVTLKIIEQHRGQILVESQPNEGTQIELRFPIVIK